MELPKWVLGDLESIWVAHNWLIMNSTQSNFNYKTLVKLMIKIKKKVQSPKSQFG